MGIFSDDGAILMQIYYMKRHSKYCNYIVELNIAIIDKSKSLLSVYAHIRTIYIVRLIQRAQCILILPIFLNSIKPYHPIN